jgi:uncharacterized membrane protein YjfL (UPF0719 family)
MEDILGKYLVASLLFSAVGIVILGGGFYMFDRLTPYDLWKQIVEEKNTALALVVGAMTIAIGMIISSAIHG